MTGSLARNPRISTSPELELHEHAIMPAVCSCVTVYVYVCRWSGEDRMGFLLLCLPISFFEAESLTEPGTQGFA